MAIATDVTPLGWNWSECKPVVLMLQRMSGKKVSLHLDNSLAKFFYVIKVV